MSFWEQFPYTNFHDLNLEWVLNEMKTLKNYVEKYTAINKVSYAGIWDITKQYPQWSVVSDEDSTYLSKQAVPNGINIDDVNYWIKLADLDPRIAGIIANLDNLGLANVRDYGAVGDGVTDDSAAFETALSQNDAVFVPSGVYYLDRTVTIPPNKTLYSMIKGQSRILYNKNHNCFNLTHDNRLENLIIETNYGDNFALYCDNGYNINIFRVDNLGGSFFNTTSKYFHIHGNSWHTVLIYDSVADCGTLNGNALEFVGTPQDMAVNRDVHIGYCFFDALLLDSDFGSTMLFKDVYACSCECTLIRAKIGRIAVQLESTVNSGMRCDLWLGMCEVRIGRTVIGNNCTLFTDGYNSVLENYGVINKMVDGKVVGIHNFDYTLDGECTFIRNLDGSFTLLKQNDKRGLIGISIPMTTRGMIVHCKYSGIPRSVGGFYVGVKNGNNIDVVCANKSQKEILENSLSYTALSSMTFVEPPVIYGRFDISDNLFFNDVWFNIVRNGTEIIWYISVSGDSWAECFRHNVAYNPTEFVLGLLDNSEIGIGYETALAVDSITFG